MVTTKNALLLAGCLFLASCNPGMNEVLGRITNDPFAEIPKVQSFNGDFSTVINWTWDEAADEYYLYRAFDDLYPQYQLVYSGPLTGYQDQFTLFNENKLYLYRLGKRRGQKLFVDFDTRGKSAIGVVSGSRRDFLEPNDTMRQATLLSDTTLQANCWYYGSNTMDNNIMYDEDWYCVDIRGHWVTSIILNDLDVPQFGVTNHFLIEIWGLGSEKIISDVKKDITNSTNSPGRFYFRIYPNFQEFQNYPLPSGGCGAFIRYTLKIAETRPE